MKKIMVTASALLFSMALTTGALAAGEYGSDQAQEGQQYQTEQQMGADQQQMQEPGAQQASAEDQVKSTNKLIGKAVKSSDGQELGNISDILVDVDSGQVGYALVSSGGVLGMGEDQYIVPWNALKSDPQTETLTLNISQDRLKQAPKGQTVADRAQAEKIFQFYGVAPYWEEGGQQETGQQPQMEDSMHQEPKMMEDESKKQMEE